MKLIKFALLILLNALLCSTLKAQINETKLLKRTDTLRSAELTSFKTNQLAEVLQASINNGIISSTNSNLNVKTTIYGIRKILDSSVQVDTNYRNQTFNRNFEVGLGLNITSSNSSISGFSTSLKYAIINNRDLSIYTSKKLKSKISDLDMRIYSLVKMDTLAEVIEKAHREGKLNNQDYTVITDALRNFTNSQSDGSVSPQKATATLKSALLPFISSEKFYIDTAFFSYALVQRVIFDSLSNAIVQQIKKGSLLTLSFNSNYQNKSWDSLTYKLEYIKGLGWQKDSSKPWDIYVGAFYSMKQDTISKQALKREVITGKLGLNKVLATKSDGSSFLEVLGAAEYDYISKGLYPSEKTSTLVADFTFTIRLAKSIFLPFELKYDPKNGNLFGFLSVKWDFLRTSDKNNK